MDHIDIYQHTDIYFLRSLSILKQLNLNPFVKYQIFIRNGPGVVAGLNQVRKILKSQTDCISNSGSIYHIKEGDQYAPGETIMVIEGRLQILSSGKP